MRVCALLLLVVSAAVEASGFAVEGGSGVVITRPSADFAITGRLTLGRAGLLELRARTFVAIGGFDSVGRRAPQHLGAGLSVRYRTPTWGRIFGFSVAGGSGVHWWSACITGDSCGGVIPFGELSPTVELLFLPAIVRPFVAVNCGLGYVLLGNPSIWFSAGLSIGAAFDFSSQTTVAPDSQREQRPVTSH